MGGFSHRGRKVYSVESVGCIYMIMWLFLITVDLALLSPIYTEAIRKVGSDQVELPPGGFINPTIENFNTDTNLEIKIQGFSNFNCEAMMASFSTDSSSIPMKCREEPNLTNLVIFSLPHKGEKGFEQEYLRLFQKEDTEIIEEAITI